jgi:hypothetical protein
MEPFKGVWFRPEYPPTPVAGHQVLMQFNDDATAILFRDFWNVVGAEAFARHLKACEQSRTRATEGEQST